MCASAIIGADMFLHHVLDNSTRRLHVYNTNLAF